MSLKLPASLEESLSAAARGRGVTRSAVVREALERFLRLPEDGGAPSCLDLAGELVGSVAGPPDLASAARHMEGYGR
jgi:hypothetical protein